MLVGSAALAQQPSLLPSVDVSFPNTVHKVQAEDICAVDFKNIRLIRNPNSAAQLHKGKYEHRFEVGGFELVTLDSVRCLDDQAVVPHYAMVQSTWSEGYGSSQDECVVQVFTLRTAHAVVVQQFEFDCHALDTGSTFDSNSKKLIIRARTDDDSPNCCAKTLDIVSYVWNKDKFKESGFRRVPAHVKKLADGTEVH